MEGFIKVFGLQKGDCVALLGSGGKTSMLYTLAALAPTDSVLMSTTTKIAMPEKTAYDHFVPQTQLLQTQANSGRTLTACLSDEGKLNAISQDVLQAVYTRYGICLLECDGSRNLPLKAWAEHEPVVPEFVSLSIGILPVWPLYKKASERLIHRFSLFSKLTGLQENQVIEPKHLARAITGERGKGMFSKAKGRKILFLNQVENEEGLRQAEHLCSILPPDFRHDLEAVVAGSVQQKQAQLLYTAKNERSF